MNQQNNSKTTISNGLILSSLPTRKVWAISLASQPTSGKDYRTCSTSQPSSTVRFNPKMSFKEVQTIVIFYPLLQPLLKDKNTSRQYSEIKLITLMEFTKSPSGLMAKSLKFQQMILYQLIITESHFSPSRTKTSFGSLYLRKLGPRFMEVMPT